MASIYFKEELEKQLEKLSVKRELCHAIKSHCKRYRIDLQQHIDEIDETNLKTLIYSAIVWDNTPQGHNFWKYISEC
jgi:hypothetical protein